MLEFVDNIDATCKFREDTVAFVQKSLCDDEIDQLRSTSKKIIGQLLWMRPIRLGV